MVARQSHILVHVERHHVLERHLAPLVRRHELLVCQHGRAACGTNQCDWGFLINKNKTLIFISEEFFVTCRTCGQAQHERALGSRLELVDALDDVRRCPVANVLQIPMIIDQ